MMSATWSEHRFIISTKSILLKILPSKMTNRSKIMMINGEPLFGMTNNFISRYSKNITVR